MDVHFICNVTQIQTYNPFLEKTIQTSLRQTSRPNAKISRIELNGLMHIKFSQAMKVPSNARNIQNDTINLNGTIYSVIVIELVPGRFTDPNMTSFTWTFVDFTP